jgi:hypothetical protein
VIEGGKMAVSLALITFGCILLTFLLLALVVGIVVIMRSSDRDVVSTARQGWINRRSEKDEEREE